MALFKSGDLSDCVFKIKISKFECMWCVFPRLTLHCSCEHTHHGLLNLFLRIDGEYCFLPRVRKWASDSQRWDIPLTSFSLSRAPARSRSRFLSCRSREGSSHHQRIADGFVGSSVTHKKINNNINVIIIIIINIIKPLSFKLCKRLGAMMN